VIVVHLSALEGTDADEETDRLTKRWREDVERPAEEAGLPAPRLVSVPSPYRQLDEPLLGFFETVKEEFPQRLLAVIVPEIVKKHWWQHLLHHRRARRLRATLLEKGGERIVVMAVPWILESEKPEDRGLLS
jgi:hypothetical protein